MDIYTSTADVVVFLLGSGGGGQINRFAFKFLINRVQTWRNIVILHEAGLQ